LIRIGAFRISDCPLSVELWGGLKIGRDMQIPPNLDGAITR